MNRKPFDERKLALVRRADTERDQKNSITGSERKKQTFGEPAKITLPRLQCLEPEKDDDLCSDCPPPDYPTDKTRCAECPRGRAHQHWSTRHDD